MTTIDLTSKTFTNDKATFRKELVNIFLDEPAGTGHGEESTRIQYNVTKLPNGKTVYLSRPGNSNTGFDFSLNVEDINFNEGLFSRDGSAKRVSTRPTHKNILMDLGEKQAENPEIYNDFAQQIELVAQCKQPTTVSFDFKSGHSSELILECIKWLFVEQDIVNWNTLGREFLNSKIKEI